jgi:hypothetical protein
MDIPRGRFLVARLSPPANRFIPHRPESQSERSGYRLDVSDDRIEGDIGDILDTIIAEGSCKACGTPWASVVNVDGKRPVKIEDGCPNEVCVLGDR